VSASTTKHRIENPDPALRLKASAEYLGVSVKSIRRYIDDKRLKAVRLGPQVLAIRQSELERFLSG
jgi:excisionase family DNA binding protein